MEGPRSKREHRQKSEKMAARALTDISENEIQDILAIDRQIFPTMPVDEEEIRETLESNGVQVVLTDTDSKAVGYIISLPHEEALAFLSDIDPALTEVAGGLYIESIGILPEHRSLANVSQLWNTFSAQAKQRGFKRITAHVRVSEGLSSVLQKRYGAIKFRTYDNWAGFDEPFDYLEIDLDGSQKESPNIVPDPQQ